MGLCILGMGALPPALKAIGRGRENRGARRAARAPTPPDASGDGGRPPPGGACEAGAAVAKPSAATPSAARPSPLRDRENPGALPWRQRIVAQGMASQNAAAG